MRKALMVLFGLGGAALVIGLAMGRVPASEAPTQPTFGTLGLSMEVPQEAADFEVTLLDGSEFSLARHLASDGRPVFLNFWASWCFPCREEMPAIDQAAADHPQVLFLGIAVEDDPSAARAFAEEVAVDYPLAIDEAGTVAARYPFFGLPTSWLIDSEGRIVRQVSGAVSLEVIEQLIAEDFGN
ncbi:MAG: TlpA family protein disulfide reductase [Actinomycetota bacterium]|nr:TlpA family protein disulfide reductase [Actinomycetota bacterium]